MTTTLLDTKTGETRTVDGPRSWEWAENNWSCDCNRMIHFGVTEEVENVCSGCHRFLVIGAEFNDSEDYEYTLEEMNEGYPEALLRKHGILTPEYANTTSEPLTAEMIREMLGHVPFDVGDMPDRWQWMANYLNETLRNPGAICPCCNTARDGQLMDHLPPPPRPSFPK